MNEKTVLKRSVHVFFIASLNHIDNEFMFTRYILYIWFYFGVYYKYHHLFNEYKDE